MKKIFHIFIIINGLSWSSYSQAGSNYFYDQAGNRRARVTISMYNPNVQQASSGQYLHRVFPNVVKEELNIEVDQDLVDSIPNLELTLFNLEGKLISEKNVGDKNEHHFDFLNLAKGVYILSLTSKSGYREEWKIIK